MIYLVIYDISFLSSNAFDNVRLSIYSISAPIGTPLARRVILTSKPSSTLLIYKARPITNSNYVSLKIDKVGNKYEFVKIQNGNAYITNSLKSLEEVKAIRDILIHSNWDFSIFDKYDLFYLNGFYWEIICTNHIIYLIEKYELIKTY